MNEQRKHERYRLWFPVQLQGRDATVAMGISHNTSVSGILIAAASPIEAGTRVRVTFRPLHESPEERSVEGRVIRVDANAEDPYGLWPHRIAVEFDTVLPELESVLKTAGEKV
ncbi:MAG: PilZ domain-containing protein [Sandaracinaceae bacterium]|nr:PilZ domain-containing protein [Sandaracinaceae bacterium]